MKDLLAIFQNQNQLAIEDAKREIRACNEFTERFGLWLSEEAIEALVQGRGVEKIRVCIGRAQGTVEYLTGKLQKNS